MIYFTSDWHIQHKNIINFCQRPFKDIDEMAEALFYNYHSVVKDNDTVFFVGDLTIKNNTKWIECVGDFYKQLKGKKFLILGNHDKFKTHDYIEYFGFESVTKYIYSKENGFYIIHDPSKCDFLDDLHSIIIHGHIHHPTPFVLFSEEYGRLNNYHTYDCGVDANDFFPISLNEIKGRLKNGYKRTIKPKILC